MKTQPNEPAFATPDSGTETITTWQGQKGLTKREYFAAMAMQGMLGYVNTTVSTTLIASESVRLADELIEALNI